MSFRVSSSNISCGVSELYCLENFAGKHTGRIFKNEFKELVKHFSAFEMPASLIFSDVEDTCGENLYRHIKENKLGHLVKSRPARNPGTGNTIVTYLWTFNEKMRKLIDEQNRYNEE